MFVRTWFQGMFTLNPSPSSIPISSMDPVFGKKLFPYLCMLMRSTCGLFINFSYVPLGWWTSKSTISTLEEKNGFVMFGSQQKK